jgi:hypothetical protein
MRLPTLDACQMVQDPARVTRILRCRGAEEVTPRLISAYETTPSAELTWEQLQGQVSGLGKVSAFELMSAGVAAGMCAGEYPCLFFFAS